MLTSEERQRIEEEERKRIAEEQYRSEVRAKFRSESAATTKESPGTRPWTVIFRHRRSGRYLLDNLSEH